MKTSKLFAFPVGIFLILASAACGGFLSKNSKQSQEKLNKNPAENKELRTMESQSNNPGNETAVLAGGCFWCLDAVYQKLQGVTAIECGYSNGKAINPSYEEVCTGNTGHAEVVKITYDNSIIS